MLMKVIGHRGARRMVTENTIESIKTALETGVDAVEFDVRTTLDNVPILQHDKSLRRTAGVPLAIPKTPYDHIRKVRTKDGRTIPTAKAALKTAAGRPVFFEIKDKYLSPAVREVLKTGGSKLAASSFHKKTLLELRRAFPQMAIYKATYFRPIHAANFAKRHGLSGVVMSIWSLNPLSYWWAKRQKLDITVFTINSRLVAALLRRLSPDISIYTDRPDKIVPLLKSS